MTTDILVLKSSRVIPEPQYGRGDLI